MIKTKNGMTKIDGTLPDLLLDPEAEKESAQAEGKASAKKGAVKETVLEADDLDGMLEWLKGELERSIKEMRNE